MRNLAMIVAAGFAALAPAQTPDPVAGRSPVPAAGSVTLPANTMIQVTTADDISSINMKVGDVKQLQVAADVGQNGVIIIPRGAPVSATVTYRTGKGIYGKSAKFELTFNEVTVRGAQYKLKGKARQEGRGATVAALLGSFVVTGKSAVITSGQVLTAFTADAIPSA